LLCNNTSFSTPLKHLLTAKDITARAYDFSIVGQSLGEDGTKALSFKIEDVAGNISQSNPYPLSLTLDTADPVLSNTTPMDNSTNVAVNSVITLIFNENIKAGKGAITLKDIGDPTQDRLIAVNDPQITINGNILTIAPTTKLSVSTNYAITVRARVPLWICQGTVSLVFQIRRVLILKLLHPFNRRMWF
jgi:methionine-rich copper-binding protein CopC